MTLNLYKIHTYMPFSPIYNHMKLKAFHCPYIRFATHFPCMPKILIFSSIFKGLLVFLVGHVGNRIQNPTTERLILWQLSYISCTLSYSVHLWLNIWQEHPYLQHVAWIYIFAWSVKNKLITNLLVSPSWHLYWNWCWFSVVLAVSRAGNQD